MHDPVFLLILVLLLTCGRFMMRSFFYLTIIPFLFMSTPLHAQFLSTDLVDVDLYNNSMPGITCKTRTNNEASVRNLAYGVWNRDGTASGESVALNCGFIMPGIWGADQTILLDNGTLLLPNVVAARIAGDIIIHFVRSPGTPVAEANNAYCNVSISNADTSALNPQQANSSTTIFLPGASPVFQGPQAQSENVTASVSTENGGNFFPNAYSFFTAFCRLPQGVRLQLIRLDGKHLQFLSISGLASLLGLSTSDPNDRQTLADLLGLTLAQLLDLLGL